MISLSLFQLFNSVLIYFNSLICTSSDPDLIYCQQCVHNNTQCEQVPAFLYTRLNHLFTTFNITAQVSKKCTTLINLEHVFMSTVHHYYQLQHHNVATSTAFPSFINSFSFHIKFSYFIKAIKDILNILCYQVCWVSLIKTRQN